jgi:acyl-CoA dehydrogenase
MQLFNDEHHQFRETVRKFVAKEITPHSAEWETNRTIPRDLWEKMGALGFLGFCYDEAYGGLDLDAVYSMILIEELTKSRCGGVEVAVSVHNDMSTTYLDLLGTHEQKIRYLAPCVQGTAICAIAVTEPDAGSDVAAIRTTAVKDSNDWVLNGQKTFISNGCCADIIIVAAKTDPKCVDAHKGISLFIVEKGTHGFTAGGRLEKMGTHACDTTELFFEDCRIPARNLLGEEGSGFKAIMKNFQKERLMAAVMSIACCEQMISDTIQYVKERKAFGTPIGSFQANKHKLVEMASETEMAKVFAYDCCQGFIAGCDMIKEISMAKYLAAELANKVAYQCVQLHGGYGYMQEYPICKAYANVRLHTIAGGTTEIMKEVIASKIGL